MLRCAALVREHTRVSAGVCTRLCETPIFCSGPAVKDQDGEPALTLPEARRMINAQLGMHHCIIINWWDWSGKSGQQGLATTHSHNFLKGFAFEKDF